MEFSFGGSVCLFVSGTTGPHLLSRFLDHTQRRTTVRRTPLDEWSVRRRDLYLTTHNTHNRQSYMPPVGFEHTISTGERPQTHALDRSATGTSKWGNILLYIDLIIRIIQVFLLTFFLFLWQDFLLKPPGGYPIAVNKYITSLVHSKHGTVQQYRQMFNPWRSTVTYLGVISDLTVIQFYVTHVVVSFTPIRMRWFPRFQVATTSFSCSPPDLNLLVTNLIFCIHVK